MRRLWRRHGRSFGRAALVSTAATALEFALLPLLLYAAQLPRVLCFAVVQLFANLVTFACNKWWAFDARLVGQTRVQYLRQLLVFGVSWVANTALPTLLAGRARVEPVLAFALSNVVVYLFWNYPANRFWVFREALPQTED